jgi:hypothetical protein
MSRSSSGASKKGQGDDKNSSSNLAPLSDTRKKRSFSLSRHRDQDGNRSDGYKSDGQGSLGQGRVKEFLSTISGSKKKSSSTSLTPSAGTVPEAASLTTTSSGGNQGSLQPRPPARISAKSHPNLANNYSLRHSNADSTTLETGVHNLQVEIKDDPFRQAVVDAEKTVDKLGTAYTILSSVSQLASVAQELLPGVGAAIGIVANMLKSAKSMSVSKVAALRTVS